MDTPSTKNKQYILNYRNKQKSLGRRARLFWLTDDENYKAKEAIKDYRQMLGQSIT